MTNILNFINKFKYLFGVVSVSNVNRLNNINNSFNITGQRILFDKSFVNNHKYKLNNTQIEEAYYSCLL
jgi:hypothetical protein